MKLLSMCIKIFFARIIDVSLGTFVTVLTVKGKRIIATIIGFVDVIIWFFVVKEALNTDVQSIWIALSYAGGYAFGTFIGTTLSNELIKGKVSVQVIFNEDKKNDINTIRNKGFAVSEVLCKGKDSNNIMLFIEVDKKHLNDLKDTISKIDKNAFITINETKYVANGFFK